MSRSARLSESEIEFFANKEWSDDEEASISDEDQNYEPENQNSSDEIDSDGESIIECPVEQEIEAASNEVIYLSKDKSISFSDKSRAIARPLSYRNVIHIRLDYFHTLRRWFREYNEGCFRLYAGPQHCVVVPTAKYMELVLSSTALTYKYDTYKFMYPWLGSGLLTSNDQYWAKHRKMITPSFHFQILQDYLHVINETTDRFMGLLEKFSRTEEIFDFQEIVTRSTLDVICETAMGTRLNTIEGVASPMVKAIYDVCDVINERVFSAFKRFDFIFVFTPAYQKQRKALRVLRTEFSKIIDERRKFLIEHEEQQISSLAENDFKRPKIAFLDNLLTAKVDGEPLTFQEIFEEVSTFMFEGHDTTASAIGFAIFSLSRQPAVQAKAFAEQFKMFGADTARQPSYQQLQEMKYLELVIKETLRIYPSVPIIMRTAKTQTTLGEYVLPQGTSIVVPIIGVSMDPHYFEQPYTFRPERFESDERQTDNPFVYVPFSAGPRNCVGQKFAVMELKVTISKILRYFEILPPVDGLTSTGLHDPTNPLDIPDKRFDPALYVTLTIKSMNGIQLRLRKRIY